MMWTDANQVIQELIDCGVDLSLYNSDDSYRIEKLTDDIYGKIQKKKMEKFAQQTQTKI